MAAGFFGKIWDKIKKFGGQVVDGFKKGIGFVAPIVKKGIDVIAPYVPGVGPALKIGGDIIGGMDKLINRK
jgi:hypothetical protein